MNELLSSSPGWIPFVEPVLEDIKKHGGHVMQVKQKFGTLRIYSHGGDYEYIEDIIRSTEDKLKDVCENCGKRNSSIVIKKNWLRTLCKECR